MERDKGDALSWTFTSFWCNSLVEASATTRKRVIDSCTLLSSSQAPRLAGKRKGCCRLCCQQGRWSGEWQCCSASSSVSAPPKCQPTPKQEPWIPKLAQPESKLMYLASSSAFWLGLSAGLARVPLSWSTGRLHWKLLFVLALGSFCRHSLSNSVFDFTPLRGICSINHASFSLIFLSSWLSLNLGFDKPKEHAGMSLYHMDKAMA